MKATILHHKTLRNLLKVGVLILFIFNSISCKSNEVYNKKSIEVLIGCGFPEIHSDILYSIEGVKKYTESHNINIDTKYSDTRCGYILKWKKDKYIKGALTDYDLMEAIKSYFQLPPLNH